ncbi:Cytosolic Fe-S cluster assembly factor NAR1 [Fusarium oxysporum f. sp. cubense race 1]|uniref:Cytosolic Fe-S cluster assembly factor NAR1 n=1 Tax=Fusarium oxysporum f. sp. cubense (strain race 1) TaxID=1229664 RepID=N4TWY2_FUSC1|nr:Cytosolic Fe-S cluster assembly factor NAR1 [Fusarium oxysporum f. sp. cubense race 1]
MSAILSADDLNDFISPGVACIKPVETLPAAPPPQPQSLETEVILDGQQPATNPNAPAQISLTDCLACSGCVTSAEAVLVSLQSHAEVLTTLDSAPALKLVTDDSGKFRVEGLEEENAKLFVVSVSPQTRANLAAACGGGVSEGDAGHMLDNLFRGPSGIASGGKYHNEFTWVVDTNTAREATLVLGADEVLGTSQTETATPAKPILASSCPGWVCYAEKTHPHVLPHISKVKSPQALMGTLLKTTLSRTLGIAPGRIWHLAVMPCFDKKLEASREELTEEVWAEGETRGRGVRDVDCVITSKEILMLAESRGLSFFNIPKTPLQSKSPTPFPDPKLHEFLFPRIRTGNAPREAGTSGGLLYHILKSRAAQTPGAEIVHTRGRNVDVAEYSILVNGEPVFRAARYYGFRNIQNLVRRLKPARPSRMPGGKPFGSARKPAGKAASLEYSYVEVMACPGGCTNGGGQIKVDDPVVMERKNYSGNPGPQEQKLWLSEVDEAYFSGDEAGTEVSVVGTAETIGGISQSYINDTLAHWAEVTGIGLDRLAFTTYREVISNVGKDTTTDETVVQLAGKIGGGW